MPPYRPRRSGQLHLELHEGRVQVADGDQGVNDAFQQVVHAGVVRHRPISNALHLGRGQVARIGAQEADQVLARAAEMTGGQIPELLHYTACIRFARRDFAGAGEYFDRALEGAPNDTSVILSRKTIQEAGPLDFQKQGEVALRLFADLKSSRFLFLGDGVREVPSLPPGDGG